jgi:CRP-like cAMP-binding protein
MKKIVRDCQLCKMRSSSIFHSLKEKEVEILNNCKSAHEYKRGQVIFYEGNPSLAIYCIHSGIVKLFKSGYSGEEFVIRLLGPSEIIGFRALLADEPFAATAQAVSDTKTCIVSKQNILNIINSSPDLSSKIMAKLAVDLRISEEQFLSRAQENVKQRTARMLLQLLETSNEYSGSNSRISMPILRSEMAQVVGTTPETLSRTLRGLAQKGIIRLTRSDISVINVDKLSAIIG